MSELRHILDQLGSNQLTFTRAASEARRFAQVLAESTGAIAPGTDLVPILRARRIREVSLSRMPEEGILFQLGNGDFGVKLNQAAGESRQRFTLMHEVGHTCFVNLNTAPLQPSYRVVDKSFEVLRSASKEEQLCNVIAGELLFPSRYIHSELLMTLPRSSLQSG